MIYILLSYHIFLLVLDLTLLLEQSALRFFASCAAATVVVAAAQTETDKQRETNRHGCLYIAVLHDEDE
jgi:hypothetical protein